MEGSGFCDEANTPKNMKKETMRLIRRCFWSVFDWIWSSSGKVKVIYELNGPLPKCTPFARFYVNIQESKMLMVLFLEIFLRMLFNAQSMQFMLKILKFDRANLNSVVCM